MEEFKMWDTMIRSTGNPDLIARWENYCRLALEDLVRVIAADNVDPDNPDAIAAMFQGCLNDLVDPVGLILGRE